MTSGAFPADVPSRVQYSRVQYSRVQYGPHLRALVVYLMEPQLVPYGRVRAVRADLFGAPPSLGTLVT